MYVHVTNLKSVFLLLTSTKTIEPIAQKHKNILLYRTAGNVCEKWSCEFATLTNRYIFRKKILLIVHIVSDHLDGKIIDNLEASWFVWPK